MTVRTRRDQDMFLVSFLSGLLTEPLANTLNREKTRLPTSTRRNSNMKKLSVVVAGTGQIRDVEIQPGTTAGDILHQLSLPDYLLSKGPNEPFFAPAEKIFASTKAEVAVY